jgi:hypothetical protein
MQTVLKALVWNDALKSYMENHYLILILIDLIFCPSVYAREWCYIVFPLLRIFQNVKETYYKKIAYIFILKAYYCGYEFILKLVYFVT